ncbi:MAG: protein kinase domain-containing protein [Myxococcota bacterium]
MSEQSGTPENPIQVERDQDPLLGRVIDNRYRILSLIAVGGMGRVYRAEQTSLGRVVAIKVLSLPRDTAEMDPQFRERFALEAATASRLANPNTVTIFDYGRTDDDLFYIVMEFVEGITLSRLLKTEKRLVAERALQIARQICHSLVEAHARGIIHRDIKPANVLLLHPDLEWVKVLDFGIAKLANDASSPELDEQLTRVGTYVGTPEYMAPESFYSKVDHRADIYSVGVLLYLMLTGRVPLQGATHTATIVMAVHDTVPKIDPGLGVPASVEAMVMRCLAKKPEERFQTMAEMLNAIATSLVEMGAALHSPTHPTITGTGVKPTLELTLRPQAHEVTRDPNVTDTSGNQRRLVVGLAAALVLLLLGIGWLQLSRSGGSVPSGVAPSGVAPSGVAPETARGTSTVPLSNPAASDPASEPASSAPASSDPVVSPASNPAGEQGSPAAASAPTLPASSGAEKGAALPTTSEASAGAAPSSVSNAAISSGANPASAERSAKSAAPPAASTSQKTDPVSVHVESPSSRASETSVSPAASRPVRTEAAPRAERPRSAERTKSRQRPAEAPAETTPAKAPANVPEGYKPSPY